MTADEKQNPMPISGFVQSPKAALQNEIQSPNPACPKPKSGFAAPDFAPRPKPKSGTSLIYQGGGGPRGTATLGSNRLPALAGEVAGLHREIEAHALSAAEKALKAGAALIEAKALVRHGEWAAWLAGTGVPERTGQGYMRLARYGLKSATVADLGGIKAALEWLRGARLPEAGEVLIASGDNLDPDGDGPSGFVWKETGGFRVAVLDIRGAQPVITNTRKPIVADTAAGESAVWSSLWAALEWQVRDLSFTTTSDRGHVASLAHLFEEHEHD